MMYCSKCGSDLRGNKSSCPACGYSLNQMKTESANKPLGYKHSEVKREFTHATLRRDEYGNPIYPYSEEAIKLREEEGKPKTLKFRPKGSTSEEEGSK